MNSCILSKFYIKPQLLSLLLKGNGVVSYRNSTSNHNPWVFFLLTRKLYLIEILHQTTTPLSDFEFSPSCILSKFYIKPQQPAELLKSRAVVSYRNSTSNHNANREQMQQLVVVSYRNSTSNHNPCR